MIKKDKFNTLGYFFTKWNQIIGIVFTVIFIIILSFIGAQVQFWVIYLSGLFIINGIWYSFSDIKYNGEEFVIEKFLFKKKIPANEFIRVEKVFLNICSITFVKNKFYYYGGHNMFFDDIKGINDEIKGNLNM